MGNNLSEETILGPSLLERMDALESEPYVSREGQVLPSETTNPLDVSHSKRHGMDDPTLTMNPRVSRTRTPGPGVEGYLGLLGQAAFVSASFVDGTYQRPSWAQLAMSRVAHSLCHLDSSSQTLEMESSTGHSQHLNQRLQETTEFFFLYRFYVGPYKLLNFFQKSPPLESFGRQLTVRDEALTPSVMNVELSQRFSTSKPCLEPLVVKTPSHVCSHHVSSTHCSDSSCVSMASSPSASTLHNTSPSMTWPQGPLKESFGYCSSELSYDFWITGVDEELEWIHINGDTPFPSGDTDFEQFEEGSFTFKHNFLRLTRSFALDGKTFEILIRCRYITHEILSSDSPNALVEHSTLSSLSLPHHYDCIPVSRLWTSDFPKTICSDYDHQDQTERVFPMASGGHKTQAQLAQELQTLYQLFPCSLHFVDGAIVGSFVRLRLKSLTKPLFSHDTLSEQQHHKENHSFSPLLHLAQPIPLEWTIVEVHGVYNSHMLQHLLLNVQRPSTDKSDASTQETTHEQLFLRKATGGRLLDVELAQTLQEWFEASQPQVSCDHPLNQSAFIISTLDLSQAYKINPETCVFYLTKPYRTLRLFSLFQSFNREGQRLCLEQFAHQKLLSLKYAVIEWYILSAMRSFESGGMKHLREMLSIPDNPFHALCKGLELLSLSTLSNQHNPINQHMLDTFHHCFPLLSPKNSIYPPYIISFHTLMLTFLDSCCFIFLNPLHFPESLYYDQPFFSTQPVHWTPITMILQLYQYIHTTPPDARDGTLWTNELNVTVCYFVATLVSLLEKQKSEEALGTWTTSTDTLLHTIITQTAWDANDALFDLHHFSSYLWEKCYSLATTLPLWSLRRCRILIDHYRFSNEWVQSSVPKVDQQNLLSSYADQVSTQLTTFTRQHVYFAQVVAKMYTELSKSCGKTVRLLELRVNKSFFSRLLRHPNARRQLARELHEAHTRLGSSFSQPSGHCSLVEACSDVAKNENSSTLNLFNASFLQSLFSTDTLNSLLNFRSKVCDVRIEFMNFVEITESGVEDQFNGGPVLEREKNSSSQDIETTFLSSTDDGLILDVMEWFKRFCWVIRFPGLEWHKGCKWISEDTIATALIQCSNTISTEQMAHIMKDEIYHSSSVLGLRSFSIVASVPHFLVRKQLLEQSSKNARTSVKDNHHAFDTLYHTLLIHSKMHNHPPVHHLLD